MKKYILALVLSGAAAAVSAQTVEPKAAPEITELKQGYKDSLDRLLVKYLKDGNVAAAAEVSVEIKRIRTELPKIEVGKAPVGFWRWNNSNAVVTFESNGLTTGDDKAYGIWKWISMQEGKAEIKWNNGYVDTFTISPDGATLHIVNNLDEKFVASKIEKTE